MLCCLLIALAGGPVLFWAGPRMTKAGGQDCCADKSRAALMMSVIGLAGLCLAMLMFAWLQPVPFRHICSVLVRP